MADANPHCKSLGAKFSTGQEQNIGNDKRSGVKFSCFERVKTVRSGVNVHGIRASILPDNVRPAIQSLYYRPGVICSHV